MVEKLIREVKAIADNGVEYIDKEEYVDAVVIPDNATNGDVIKALFPNFKHTKIITNGVYECHIDHKRHTFDYSWWNAPYRKEQ